MEHWTNNLPVRGPSDDCLWDGSLGRSSLPVWRLNESLNQSVTKLHKCILAIHSCFLCLWGTPSFNKRQARPVLRLKEHHPCTRVVVRSNWCVIGQRVSLSRDVDVKYICTSNQTSTVIVKKMYYFWTNRLQWLVINETRNNFGSMMSLMWRVK